MAYRDILATAASVDADAAVWSFATELARARNAHLSGLLVNWIPALSTVVEGWVVDARWGELVEEARGTLERDRQALAGRLEKVVDRSSADAILIEPGAARAVVSLYARHADISVVARPHKGLGETRSALLEAVLFGSGRPAIVVPPDWKPGPLGKTVMVCWNAGREAARALADALPLFDPAAKVVVATVDAKPHLEGHGEMPGVDIATHLTRHGFKVEVRNIDSGGRPDAKALLDAATAEGVDLIVMGGYGRSRLSEVVFGGVTRDMLTSASVPVLMSH